MILNDNEIRKRVTDYQLMGMDHPLISPFSESQLQGASYDVTIDKEVIRIIRTNELVDLKEQSAIDRTYERHIIGEDGFILMPHSSTLVTLKETFFIPPNLTAHIRPKTRFVRLGLFVSGQHINPDSICKLNICIYNMTDNPFRIYESMSIAQIVFEEMIDIPSKDKLYKSKRDSHYSNDIDFVGATFSDEYAALIDDEVRRLLGKTEE